MRLNNLSARLMVNQWLKNTDREPLPPHLSYEDFATQLRVIVAKKRHQAPFATRADAAAYIRHVASNYAK